MTERQRSIGSRRKRGDEAFHFSGSVAGFSVLTFWQWASSNVLNNAFRGNLAEYLVGRAVGADGIEDDVRATWDSHDLVTLEGMRIEVKSSAYVQDWPQKKAHRPSFEIRKTRGEDGTVKRHSDVYVFCLLSEDDPTNLDRWEFYVLPTVRLDTDPVYAERKRIGLQPLRERASPVSFGQLGDSFARAVAGASHGGQTISSGGAAVAKENSSGGPVVPVARKRAWNEQSFFEVVAAELVADVANAIRRVYDAAVRDGFEVSWGSGAVGSFGLREPSISRKSLVTIHTDGRLWLNCGWFGDTDSARKARDRLRDGVAGELGLDVPPLADRPFPAFPVHQWIAKADDLVRIVIEIGRSARTLA